ncbi:hypothetical protein PS467_00590 [Streptomyces luomodiensis]|uniref:Uncharacterized protein n=1 Tax=Streptomyces luomodiensis TaxID=3026192 RepID=A0ABY9UPZ4_9ACTN|nr:hypothetical protein [Streptomyces sp. SCA4-21]WNE93929.1 hypothetical protein PS467_00590 [Streptomyces sp. SCA4-21]
MDTRFNLNAATVPGPRATGGKAVRSEHPVRRWPALRVPPQATDWNNNLGFHGFSSLWVTGGD